MTQRGVYHGNFVGAKDFAQCLQEFIEDDVLPMFLFELTGRIACNEAGEHSRLPVAVQGPKQVELATFRLLRRIAHTGCRVLVHKAKPIQSQARGVASPCY